MYPPVVCLTDCHDPNATARLGARIATLFGQAPVMVPLAGTSVSTSAALTLLDTLLATGRLGCQPYPITVLVNIAPRDGQWPNGAPFCYFRYGQHLVVSTFSPEVFALVRTHLGVDRVYVTDIDEAVRAADGAWATFAPGEVDHIVQTQFRSLWYLPLLARWVCDGRPVPVVQTPIDAPDQMDGAVVAVVDNFGNCKLNRSATEIGFVAGSTRKVATYRDGWADGRREVSCYQHLREVPVGEAGLIVGSSGHDFVELVVGCGSAAETFGLVVGAEVL